MEDENLPLEIQEDPDRLPPSVNSDSVSILAFDPLDEEVAQQEVTIGTALEALILPGTLVAILEKGNGDVVDFPIPVVRWHAAPDYDPMEMGTYIFTPEFTEGYTLGDNVIPPEITVQVLVGILPMVAQHTISSYSELSTQLGNYSSASDDVEILLAPDFPVDSMSGIFTIRGNTGGYTLTIRSADSEAPVVLTRSSSALGHLFKVSSGAHLILEDVVLDGGKHSGIEASGSLVNIDGGNLTMRAGAVLQNNNDTSRWGSGGGVSVYNGGTFIMEDGRISGNTVTDRGGGVFVNNNNRTTSTFIMEGGRISDNTAKGEGGGGVHVNVTFTNCFGVFHMKGGTVSGNSTTNSSSGHGGGVYVGGANTSITMEGGEISGNTSEGAGAGVYVSSTIFTMKDGLISGNQTAYHGGGVHVSGSGSNFVMEYGTILGNRASGLGGGVYNSNSGGFTLVDGLISDNNANNGGGIATANSSFTMKGGRIVDNTAKLNGGGISGTGINSFNLENGLVSNNTAGQHGGGVYLSNKTATMWDCQIVENEATRNGGGVYSDNGVRFTMEGGLISGNTADENGGGVYSRDSGKFTMTAGLISHNKAASGNGVYVVNTANLTMSGGLIFGQGNNETSVTYPAIWEPDAIGNGVAIRWSGSDDSIYLYGDDEDLYPLPANSAQGIWTIDTDRHGVAYARDNNVGFAELPVTVRYPIEVSISGIFRFDETLSAPSSLPAPPVGGWGALSYQWTRDGIPIPGAVGSTYIQVEEDIGKILNVTITAANGYAPVSSTNTVPTAKALQPAPPAFVLNYTYDRQTDTYVVTIPEVSGGEYSFDGITYGATRTTTKSPGEMVTGTVRYAETATHEASPATDSSTTLPILVTLITVTGEGGQSQITIKGGTLQMLANVQPLEANQAVTWMVVSGSAATIDIAGLLTAVSNGSVTVRATATDGSGVYGEMTLAISGQDGGGIPSPPGYTVTYRPNGGQGRVPNPDIVREGTPYTILEPALVRPDGQRFVEWNTDSTGDGTGYVPGQIITMPAHSLVLYAIWEEVSFDVSHTVTFHPNGGSVFPTILQTGVDGKLAYLPTPTRDGSYQFIGWYTTASNGRQIDVDHVFEKDADLYAHWSYIDSSGNGGGNTYIPDTSVPGTSDTSSLDNLSIIVHVNDVFTLPSSIDIPGESSGLGWDESFLSASFSPTVTFTALRKGVTTVTYVDVFGNRGAITVTILPGEDILTSTPNIDGGAKYNPQTGTVPSAQGYRKSRCQPIH